MKKTSNLVAALALTLSAAPAAFASADADLVYTMNNNTASNSVVAFERAEDGSLTMVGAYETGGKGLGGDIDDQHSLQVSGSWVIAANPGSHDITVLKKGSGGLKKVGQYPSGGMNPVSLSVSGNMVVVANQAVTSGTPNLTTFKLGEDGSLQKMGSTDMAFKAGAGPADVEFAPGGKMLAATYGYQSESSSMVATFGMDSKGGLSMISAAPAYGPVGLSWNPKGNHLYVSTFRGASILSFGVEPSGKLMAAKKLVDGETAACWTTVNKAGDRLYVANFVSNSISVYSLNEMGEATFISAAKRPEVSGNDTKDIALSQDGRFLHVLGTNSKRIDTFKVAEDGSLKFANSSKPMMGGDNWKGLAVG